MDILSIGQMAKLNCVSEKALRIYHKEGILIPQYIDENTGYRYYSMQQCATLDMILQLKEMGFTLSSIKGILDVHEVPYLKAAIQKRIHAMEQSIKRLNSAKNTAEQMLNQCDFMLSKPRMGRILIEELPTRYILRFFIHSFSVMRELNPASLALDLWEKDLRLVKKQMLDMGLPLTLFRNIGCTVTKANLQRRNITFEDAFIFVDKSIEKAECVPAGRFVSMYCDGVISEDGEYMEEKYLLTMLDYIKDNGLTIAGDYLGEVLAETPAFHYVNRDMLIKLQVPIEAD